MSRNRDQKVSRGNKAVAGSTVSREHCHATIHSQGWQGEGISNEYLMGEEKPSGISPLSFSAQMHLKVWTLPNFVNDRSKAVITIRFKECKIKLQIFPERSCILDARQAQSAQGSWHQVMSPGEKLSIWLLPAQDSLGQRV